MPRPPRAREGLLDAAEALFLEHGIAPASLDDVCQRADVSKGALFYHFGSKSALAAAAVVRFGERLAAGVPDVGPDARRRLLTFLDDVEGSGALAAGCLLGTASMSDDAVVADAARERLDEITRRLGDLIAAARPDVDAPGLATAILAAVEGGLVLDRHARGIPATKTAIKHMKAYLSTILEEDG